MLLLLVLLHDLLFLPVVLLLGLSGGEHDGEELGEVLGAVSAGVLVNVNFLIVVDLGVLVGVDGRGQA